MLEHWRISSQEVWLNFENFSLHHYLFIISQLWLTFHPRSTEVLLDTGTPGTSREIYSEDANDGTQTHNPLVINPSALAIKLISSKAIAGKKLSLSSWCTALLCIYHFSTVVYFSSENSHLNICYYRQDLFG